MTEQQLAFWDLIEVFDKDGLLPYVMLIGSWAEYIYQLELKSGFKSNLRTRDADFLYLNINLPKDKVFNIAKSMGEKGFVYTEDSISGVGKFLKEDLLELEFITRVLGQGRSINEIKSLKIRAEGLRTVNMLAAYPLRINTSTLYSGIINSVITVPEPEAYIVQKLLANPTRTPTFKQEKDIQAVRELLGHVNKRRVHDILVGLTKKEMAAVNDTAERNFLSL